MKHKFTCILCAVTILCACSKHKQDDTNTNTDPVYPPESHANWNHYDSLVETQSVVNVAVQYNINSNIAGYYVAKPSMYDSTTKQYPLLISMAGDGERGNGTTDLYMLLNVSVAKQIAQKTFPPNFAFKGENYSFVVISPQFKQSPTAQDLKDLLAYAQKTYRINPNRVYAAGLSTGAGIIWEYAVGNRGLAAAVPMASAAFLSKDDCNKIAGNDIPFWVFHNTQDPLFASSQIDSYIGLVNSNNPKVPVKKTFFNASVHDCWTTATDPNYRENGKNIYEFMLTYRIQ